MKRKLHGCLKLCLHCRPVFQCSFALMALLMLQYKQRVFSWCHLCRSDSNCGRELTAAKYSGMVTTPQSLLGLAAFLKKNVFKNLHFPWKKGKSDEDVGRLKGPLTASITFSGQHSPSPRCTPSSREFMLLPWGAESPVVSHSSSCQENTAVSSQGTAEVWGFTLKSKLC